MIYDKKWWIDEARSFLTTLLCFFAIDAYAQLSQLYSGDWSDLLFTNYGWHYLEVQLRHY